MAKDIFPVSEYTQDIVAVSEYVEPKKKKEKSFWDKTKEWVEDVKPALESIPKYAEAIPAVATSLLEGAIYPVNRVVSSVMGATPQESRDFANEIVERGTYEPVTKEGKAATALAMTPFEFLGEVISPVTQTIGQMVGQSPLGSIPYVKNVAPVLAEESANLALYGKAFKLAGGATKAAAGKVREAGGIANLKEALSMEGVTPEVNPIRRNAASAERVGSVPEGEIVPVSEFIEGAKPFDIYRDVTSGMENALVSDIRGGSTHDVGRFAGRSEQPVPNIVKDSQGRWLDNTTGEYLTLEEAAARKLGIETAKPKFEEVRTDAKTQQEIWSEDVYSSERGLPREDRVGSDGSWWDGVNVKPDTTPIEGTAGFDLHRGYNPNGAENGLRVVDEMYRKRKVAPEDMNKGDLHPLITREREYLIKLYEEKNGPLRILTPEEQYAKLAEELPREGKGEQSTLRAKSQKKLDQFEPLTGNEQIEKTLLNFKKKEWNRYGETRDPNKPPYGFMKDAEGNLFEESWHQEQVKSKANIAALRTAEQQVKTLENELKNTKNLNSRRRIQREIENAKVKHQKAYDDLTRRAGIEEGLSPRIDELTAIDRVPLRPIAEYGTGTKQTWRGIDTAPEPLSKGPEGIRGRAVDGFDSLVSDIRGGSTHDVGDFAGRQSATGGSAINMNQINTDIGVKRIMDAKAREMEAEIGRNPVSINELWEQGKALEWDANQATSFWGKNKSLTAAQGLAVRQLHVNAWESLYKAIQELPAGTRELPAALREQAKQAMSLMKVTSQAASEAGRQLRIHGQPVEFSSDFGSGVGLKKAMKQLEKLAPENLDVLVDKLRNIDPTDATVIDKVIIDGTSTLASKLNKGAYELYLNILLSNPLTHIKNVLGNSAQLFVSPVNRAVSGGLNQAIAKARGTVPERFASEAWHEMASVKEAAREGVKRAAEAWKNDDNFGPLDANPSGTSKYSIPLRALGAMDAFFKGIAETGDLHATAARAAKQKGLSGQSMIDDMAQSISNPSGEMLSSAVKKGLEATFQQELPKFVSSIIRAKNGNAVVATQIPFVKTPFNIVAEGIRYMPTSLAKYFTYDLYKVYKGKMSVGEWTDKVAKPLVVGSVITAAVTLLASEGKITGSGPSNKDKRNELIQSGWQPYSIKVDNNYYSYRAIEPFATTIGITADIANGYFDEKTEDSMAAIAVDALKNNIIDKSFLKNLADLFNTWSDPRKNLEKWARNYAGSWVPAVVGGAERATDDQFRDVQSIGDAVQSRIPILAEQLQPKLTVWGGEMKRQSTPLERAFSPIQRSEEKGSPLERAMVELDKYQIGYPERKINGVEMSPEEYWAFVKEAREPAKKMLDMIAGTQAWKRMDDEHKIQQVKRYVGRYGNVARERMRRKMIMDGRLSRNSVGHLVAVEDEE